MSAFILFGFQSTFSLIVFTLIAKWYVAPRLTHKPLADALIPLLLVHLFRYTPLTLLVPGQVAANVPRDVAASIAYGDLVAAIFALLATLLLRYRKPGAVLVTWLFTIVGIADIVMAIVHGMGSHLYEYALGFNWYILNFYVPALIVTHVMIVARLLRRRPTAASV